MGTLNVSKIVGTGANNTLDIDADTIATQSPSFYTENECINGTFDVWQRNSSQTSTGYASCDRWNHGTTSSTKTASRENFTVGQTDVPGSPIYFLRTDFTSANTTSSYVNTNTRLLDVSRFAGKRVCIKFHAKAGSALDMSLECEQNFGSGGSSIIDGIGAQKISLTTSWQKFVLFIDFPSISGKTVGSLGFSKIRFWFEAGSDRDTTTASLGNQTGIIDIAEIEVYISNVELPIRRRCLDEELILCYPFFQKSYNLWTVVGAVTTVGSIASRNQDSSTRSNSQCEIYTSIPMIQNPTVVLYSTSDGAAGYVYCSSPAGNTASSVTNTGRHSLSQFINTTAFVNNGGYIYFHWTADSEV